MPHAPAQTAAAAISGPPGATVGASGTDEADGGAEARTFDAMWPEYREPYAAWLANWPVGTPDEPYWPAFADAIDAARTPLLSELTAARAELADLQHGMATYVRDRIGPVCAERDRALAELARYTDGTWSVEWGAQSDGGCGVVFLAEHAEQVARTYVAEEPDVRLIRRRVWTGPVEPITAEETPDHA